MPSRESISAFESFPILLAPHACKCIPPSDVTFADLRSQGWSDVTMGVAPERSMYLKYGIQGRRKQYGLKHRISATVHAVMGQDLNGIVSRVVEDTIDPTYSLWMASQVVVLMSRTNFARQIVFIGAPVETCRALVNVLSKQTQHSVYLAKVVGILTGSLSVIPSQMTLDIPQFFPYRACDLPVPVDNSGVVYLIVSMHNNNATYIGQTVRLNKRIVEHNSGIGAKQTSAIELRPWALYGLICGFAKDRRTMLIVEAAWKMARRNERERRNGPLTATDVLNLGQNLVTHTMQNLGLRFVICGRFGNEND